MAENKRVTGGNNPIHGLEVLTPPITDEKTAVTCSFPHFKGHLSGQIIATSHDRFPPNGGLVREIPGW